MTQEEFDKVIRESDEICQELNADILRIEAQEKAEEELRQKQLLEKPPTPPKGTLDRLGDAVQRLPLALAWGLFWHHLTDPGDKGK